MRQKKEQLIITFSTTSEAMRMEKYCVDHEIEGRLIPLPAEISAGCGLAWKTEPEAQQVLKQELLQAGIGWETMEVRTL